MSQMPPSDPTLSTPPPPTIPGPLMGGLRPDRSGLILGLGIGSLAVWLLSAIGSLVLPFCGCSGVISLGMAIPAWIMANADLAAMKAGQMSLAGRSGTHAGKVCAMISVGLHILSFVLIVLLVILGIAVFGAAAAAGAAKHP